MPAIRINNEEEYGEIIKVLDRVGGTWQGVNREGFCLLVSPRHYSALVDANVVIPSDVHKDSNNGKKPQKAKP